jgi:hypothetical protein
MWIIAWLVLAEACIAVWPEARYGAVGWNHIVHIQNRCDQAFTCDVSTDVNPQPQRVIVGPHQELEVVTFLDSPWRVFTPNVQCK